MITLFPYKNRTIDLKELVDVYWNSNKRCFSVRQNGDVVAHTNNLMLKDVAFNINRSGQNRVRKTGIKNVHAVISGYIIKPIRLEKPTRVVYNPNKYRHFMCTEKGQAIVASPFVKLQAKGYALVECI